MINQPKPSPRISVNKLGEYMDASASRRRQIVVNQMTPPQCIVPTYTPAQSAIADYFADGSRTADIIYRQMRNLNDAKTDRKWYVDRNRLCIEALESFLGIQDVINLRDVEYRKVDARRPASMQLAGVQISVRPEVVLRGHTKDGSSTCGAIKLYFSKDHPLTDSTGAYTATLVHEYAQTTLTGTADRRLSFVVDVFQQKLYRVPKATIQRRSEVEAALEEYERAWRDRYNRLYS